MYHSLRTPTTKMLIPASFMTALRAQGSGHSQLSGGQKPDRENRRFWNVPRYLQL